MEHLTVESGSNVHLSKLTINYSKGIGALTNLDMQKCHIKRYITQSITNPDLSPKLIAKRFNCSVRHVYSVFENDEMTLSRYISNQRLSHSAELLRNPSHVNRTILDLAFASGFGNISSYCRAFRNHYGVTPGQYRSLFNPSISCAE